MKTKNIKNPFIRITAYIFVSLLCIAIGYTFLANPYKTPSSNPNTAALVNGEEITKQNVLRVRDLVYGEKMKEGFDNAKYKQLLDEMIRAKLLMQYATKQGIAISDERVADMVRKVVTGGRGANANILKGFFTNNKQFSPDMFFVIVKEMSLGGEVQRMMYNGVGVSPEEIEFRNVAMNGSFQVKFAFLGNDEFRKKFAATAPVSDKEIDEEMSKNKNEIKDPVTDREAFRVRIIDRKLSAIKKEIISSINDVAAKGESFEKTLALLGVQAKLTDPFKAGEQMKEQGVAGKPLYSLSDSEVFRKDFAAIKIGTASRAIETSMGIYIFTPVKKEIMAVKKDEKGTETAMQELAYMKMNYFRTAVLNSFFEKAKIDRGTMDEETASE
jgi:hypothetical protein